MKKNKEGKILWWGGGGVEKGGRVTISANCEKENIRG